MAYVNGCKENLSQAPDRTKIDYNEDHPQQTTYRLLRFIFFVRRLVLPSTLDKNIATFKNALSINNTQYKQDY